MGPWEPIILSCITVGSLAVTYVMGYMSGARDQRYKLEDVGREIWTTQQRIAHREAMLRDTDEHHQ